MNKRDDYAGMDLGRALVEPGFGEGRVVAAGRDPVIRTRVTLKLNQLQPYEHNPRRAANPCFDEIKASIRARGLDHPPPVSRRPGDAHFIIVNGGNSRLRALQELYKETGDPRFEEIDCDFIPWPGEVQALTGHLIENDVRGEMTFLDRALAVRKLRSFHEQEHGDLSLRDLAARLEQAGYRIHASHLSKLFQTLEYLYPAIPRALEAGLGKHQVERVLRLRSACSKFWEVRGEAADVFPSMFCDALQGTDGAVWSYDTAEEAVLHLMAERLAHPYSLVRKEVLSAQRGRSRTEASGIAKEVSPENGAPLSRSVALDSAAAVDTGSPGTSERMSADGIDPLVLDRAALELLTRSAQLLPATVAELRSLLVLKVTRFAGMLPPGENWIKQTPDQGLGFTVQPASKDFEGDRHAKARREVYWFLQGLVADQELKDGAAWTELARVITPASAINLLTAAEWDRHTSASALAIALVAREIRHRLGWR